MKLNGNLLAEKTYGRVYHSTNIDSPSHFTEILPVIEQIIEPKYLNKIQILVLKYTWQGLSYLEISRLLKYNLGYVKDTGSRIWKMLSDALGVKVTKYNVQIVLRQYIRRLQNNISVDWYNFSLLNLN